MQHGSTLKVIITVETKKVEFESNINQLFNSDTEIVFRKSNFVSKRTLGINCTLSSRDIKRSILPFLQNPSELLNITFESC